MLACQLNCVCSTACILTFTFLFQFNFLFSSLLSKSKDLETKPTITLYTGFVYQFVCTGFFSACVKTTITKAKETCKFFYILIQMGIFSFFVRCFGIHCRRSYQQFTWTCNWYWRCLFCCHHANNSTFSFLLWHWLEWIVGNSFLFSSASSIVKLHYAFVWFWVVWHHILEIYGEIFDKSFIESRPKCWLAGMDV